MIGDIRVVQFEEGFNDHTMEPQAQRSVVYGDKHVMYVPDHNSPTSLLEMAMAGEFMLCQEKRELLNKGKYSIMTVGLITYLSTGVATFKKVGAQWVAETRVNNIVTVRLTVDRGCEQPMGPGSFRFRCKKVTHSFNEAPHIYVEIIYPKVIPVAKPKSAAA